MSTVRKPGGRSPDPTKTNPYFYGYREVWQKDEHGREILVKQPLTEEHKQRFGGPLRRLAETRTRDLPLCKPPGEETREMEPRHHARNHETLPLG